MNATVALLTARTVLGRRRALLLLIIPVALLGLAAVIRAAAGVDRQLSTQLLGNVALGTLVPLLGLIAGTGAIGPEIDDGSIIYLLSKPQNRLVIVITKLAVAIGVMTAFATVPVLLAGLLMGIGGAAWGYALAALAAGVAYSALFLLLAVLTRNAVLVGLGYALIWESLIGSFVPGAQTLSVQQWALALTQAVSSSSMVTSAVNLAPAIILLCAVSLVTTLLAGHRLRSLRLTSES